MITAQTSLAAALAVVVTLTFPAAAEARDIERACMAGGRTSNATLCRCIQGVADQLLTGRDQRRAASFFDDPHLAQEVRMSDRSGDERFWLRYKQFGSVAAARCG